MYVTVLTIARHQTNRKRNFSQDARHLKLGCTNGQLLNLEVEKWLSLSHLHQCKIHLVLTFALKQELCIIC